MLPTADASAEQSTVTARKKAIPIAKMATNFCHGLSRRPLILPLDIRTANNLSGYWRMS